jgi:hypothetical protein
MNNKINSELVQLSNIISNDFKKHGLEFQLLESESFNSFKLFLTERIKEAMDKKFDLLINTLYLIDINEEKVNKLFAEDNRENIPAALADLIIERQMQKLKYRGLYKKGEL